MKNKAVWHRSRQEGKKRESSVSCHSFQGKKGKNHILSVNAQATDMSSYPEE